MLVVIPVQLQGRRKLWPKMCVFNLCNDATLIRNQALMNNCGIYGVVFLIYFDSIDEKDTS